MHFYFPSFSKMVLFLRERNILSFRVNENSDNDSNDDSNDESDNKSNEESDNNSENEIQEIEYKKKLYHLIDDKIYNININGKTGTLFANYKNGKIIKI